MLGLGDPEIMFEFDGNLTGDELAAKGAVWWKPRGGVGVAFLHVGGAVDSEEVKGVV